MVEKSGKSSEFEMSELPDILIESSSNRREDSSGEATYPLENLVYKSPDSSFREESILQEQIGQLEAELITMNRIKAEKVGVLKQLHEYSQLKQSIQALTNEKLTLDNTLSLRSLNSEGNNEACERETKYLKEKLAIIESEQTDSLKTLVDALNILKSQLSTENQNKYEHDKEEEKLQEEETKSIREELNSTRQAIEKIKFEICSKEAEMRSHTEELEFRRCRCLLF